MDRQRRCSRLVSMLLVLMTGSVVVLGRTPEASGATAEALDGRVFAIEATNCGGDEFTDTFCFAGNVMTVESLNCRSGPLLENGADFAAFVRRVLFLGTAHDGTISGSGLFNGCVSTFSGTEISQCPCPAPEAEPGEANPYSR